MLILHIIINLGGGGAEHMLKRLAAAHAEAPGYRHEVISLRELNVVGPQLQALGVPVMALGMRSGLSFPWIMMRLASEIRSRKPDIVQTWMYHADLLGGLAARVAGLKNIIWGVRTADIRPKAGVAKATLAITRACAMLSSSIPSKIVYVAHSARSVHEEFGYAPGKSVVIPNGYQLPDVELRASRPRIRTELGIPADALLVGSAGRFNAQKDHRTFVEAAGALAAREPRARFMMMGLGVDRSNPELMQWVRESGHEDRFHLLGERSDILACLSALDVFCLHSVGEGFPNVLAEAMSVAVPCVTTDVGDAAPLVGDTGTVVPPSEPAAIADALYRMLSAGAEVRARLGAAAHARIAADYSMDAIRKRFEDLYAEVLTSTSSMEAGGSNRVSSAGTSAKLRDIS